MDLTRYKTLFLSETREHIQKMTHEILKAAEGPRDALNEQLFRSAHSIKGMASTMNYSDLRDLSHQMETLFLKLKAGNIAITEETTTVILSGLDLMQLLVDEIDQKGSSQTQVHNYTAALDQLYSALSQRTEPQKKETESPTAKTSKTVRIEAAKLDRLLESAAELINFQSQVETEGVDPSDFSKFRVLSREIWDATIDLRMFPFDVLSQPFARLVHDLAVRLGKKVNFKIEDRGIRMDKMVIEELADPLVHLLRNAIDHGIELPAERTRQGKNETGNISLSLQRQGDLISIDLEDDGKGIHPAAIRKHAVERGFISQERAMVLTEEELFSLLTLHGFSTANHVTEISGRGLGLDVVRSKIESLGGTLQIQSVPGRFTRFELKVPFTVALIRVVLVKCESGILAVPISRIDRFVHVLKKDVSQAQGQPVCHDGEDVLFVETLNTVLTGMSSNDLTIDSPAFITVHQNKKIAWCVGELLEEREILWRPFGEPLSLLDCYHGAAVIGHHVVPVLDMEQLYRELILRQV